MSSSRILHLPDGKRFTVTPVFGGMGFRAHDYNHLLHPFPAGWMTMLHTEVDSAELNGSETSDDSDDQDDEAYRRSRPFHRPTLQNDSLFISSISIPSDTDFKPAPSPTREIAMMLWITLYWYFHQPAPDQTLDTAASRETPASGKPTGEWKLRIKRDGIFRGRNLIPKLERMGLIASEDTSVDDNGDGWTNMFVSRRMFWQLPPNLFLFTLQPTGRASLAGLPSAPGSPRTSRPGSPMADVAHFDHRPRHSHGLVMTPAGGHSTAADDGAASSGRSSVSHPIGPYFSSSQLPTYYPPPPLQHTLTNGVRHPVRPKPPRMGEVFYTRFIETQNQYLSFRVASSSPQPVPYLGPVGPSPPKQDHLCTLSDKQLLESWFKSPRIQEFWGKFTPDFLETALRSRHSFPVLGLWDGVPFGYFEVYWVKEDILGRHVGSVADDWDRGIHVMVGEEWSRGRVAAWLTSLVHWCFTADYRSMNVCLEPRVDNKRMLKHLDACGFAREKQVSFPHKQAWYVKLRREHWDGPEL